MKGGGEGARRPMPVDDVPATAGLVGLGSKSHMPYQDDIDAVLTEAQSAVSALASDVNDLSNRTPSARGSSTVAPAPIRRPLSASPDHMQRILKLKVPVVVRLANRTMSVAEIMKITPGTILEFSRGIEQDLDLLINNHQIGNGVAVKVNEHFGVRLTYVGDVRNRINSLKAS
jgi:flagellar motor switch/type III secretory pathway protein FliN